MILGIVICGCGEGKYRYLEQEEVKWVEVVRKPVYIDPWFSDTDKVKIEMGIDRWNKTLNGYMVVEVRDG
jgi:hypothetical protein